MDVLKALQYWYRSHCDGIWEHNWGVKIETLDNPGWRVDINLVGVCLEGRNFPAVQENRSDDDWIRCVVEQNVYKGRGGPENLEELLRLFLSWATRSDGR
jgi:hypothetical protein